jgi:hypothetical protein
VRRQYGIFLWSLLGAPEPRSFGTRSKSLAVQGLRSAVVVVMRRMATTLNSRRTTIRPSVNRKDFGYEPVVSLHSAMATVVR